jgi:ubiquinone/menaquinone biosynthesis C-methylase UbiE
VSDTARSLLQVHLHARYYGIDLSPFYVEFARSRLGGGEGTRLLAENAETMPFRDGWFDAVMSVYLFHELPRSARRNVLSEMWRVLAPGGLLVIEDSAQPSEGGEVQLFLERFSDDFHEPFYRDYLKDEQVGFELDSVEPCFVSKPVVARKPR